MFAHVFALVVFKYLLMYMYFLCIFNVFLEYFSLLEVVKYTKNTGR